MNYRPQVLTQAMFLLRAHPTPVIHLESMAGMSKGAFHRWGQQTSGNGATVGCLDAILRAAGYKLTIVRS